MTVKISLQVSRQTHLRHAVIYFHRNLLISNAGAHRIVRNGSVPVFRFCTEAVEL
jgi:hypothetical protein